MLDEGSLVRAFVVYIRNHWICPVENIDGQGRPPSPQVSQNADMQMDFGLLCLHVAKDLFLICGALLS